MVNTGDFIQRLEHLLEYYDLSASSFADKVNVQRSSISHLLSGRNKPSLDFVLKVVKAFPEVNLYWLLNGKGSFPAEEKTKDNAIPTESQVQKPTIRSTSTASVQRTIDRIVIFFSDGSFEAYEH